MLYLRLSWVFILFFISIFNASAIERNKALVIGISQYTEVNSLKYADADALQIYQYISKFSEFNPDDIDLLLNLNATKSNIESSLQKVAVDSANNPYQDFLFYYAGHGVGSRLSYVTGKSTDTDDTNVFLVPSDAKPSVDNFVKNSDSIMTNRTFITTHWLANALSNIRAKKITIILDSCYSGNERFYDELKSAYLKIDSRQKPELAYIASTKDNQEAVEYDELGHGALSYAIFEFLKVKARSQNGLDFNQVKYSELFSDIPKLFSEIQVAGKELESSHQPTFFGIPSLQSIENKVFINIKSFGSGIGDSNALGISKLIINSILKEYKFYADGEELTKNLRGEYEVLPGRHMFEYYVPSTGYRYTFVRDMIGFQVLRENILSTGKLIVEAKFSEGKIGGKEQKIEVLIDGISLGLHSSLESELTAGSHKIEVKYADAVSKKDVEIRPNSPLRIVYKLESKTDQQNTKNINNVMF